VPAHFHERASAPERKTWMSEDPRMAIFDATAFALIFFRSTKGTGGDSRNSDSLPFDNIGSLN
jgi:hypothetical protein